MILLQRVVSWVKKVGGEGSCHFSTDTSNFRQNSASSCKLPTQKIMGAQNFNSDPKFPHNGGFQPQILHLKCEDFWKIFWQLKIIPSTSPATKPLAIDLLQEGWPAQLALNYRKHSPVPLSLYHTRLRPTHCTWNTDSCMSCSVCPPTAPMVGRSHTHSRNPTSSTTDWRWQTSWGVAVGLFSGRLNATPQDIQTAGSWNW